MNNVTFFPGQLLRVTLSFTGINPATGRLHNFMKGDVFFLVSIDKEDTHLPQHEDHNTTLVTNTGELVVVVAEWYESGFTQSAGHQPLHNLTTLSKPLPTP